jgi:hypothetical protein
MLDGVLDIDSLVGIGDALVLVTLFDMTIENGLKVELLTVTAVTAE